MHLAEQKWRGLWEPVVSGRTPRPKDTGSPKDKLAFQKPCEPCRPQGAAGRLVPGLTCGTFGILGPLTPGPRPPEEP